MVLVWSSHRNCGVQDPSWSEIHNFAKFLNLQLEACEKSVFCDENLVGDIMSGLKGFVVKFMISMSRVSITIIIYNCHIILYIDILLIRTLPLLLFEGR